MANCCVVSFGDTEYYQQGIMRQETAVWQHSPGTRYLARTKKPEIWPEHKNYPYAFKAYALKEAAEKSDLLLWCDAVVLPIRDMGTLWERIERDGYWFSVLGWTNYEWTAESAYKDLFPDLSLDDARRISRTFPQVIATAFGLNVKSEIGKTFLDEYYRLANTEAFYGPWSNTNYPKHFNYGEGSSYSMGPCGPPDVFGHRHDQTAASMLAWKLGMKLTNQPDIFGYTRNDTRTILLANGDTK